uniref:Uncharacterized protein n=1 Tax=Zea mays TaxID=4577 RepID=A0A804QDV0_MAIZE
MRLLDHDALRRRRALAAVAVLLLGLGGRRQVPLPAAVVEVDAGRRARLEEPRLAGHGGQARREAPGGAPPRHEEVAGGVAVGHDVVGREPDGE